MQIIIFILGITILSTIPAVIGIFIMYNIASFFEKRREKREKLESDLGTKTTRIIKN